MKKRIVSAVMALILCLTLLPTAALAADGAWDGSIATAFAGGTGTESDPYQIANGAELAYLASSVNSGETYTGKNFVLTANIDLNGLPWTPIANSFSDALLGGSDYRIFAGNFDGNGYTISNVSIGSETAPLEADVFGLFGATAGKISNLNLDTVSIHGIAKIASIGAVIGFAGGLVGYSGGYIENCHVTGLTMDMSAPSNVYAAAYCVGGLVGVLDETQLINECSVSGSITEKAGKGSIGGLIGELGKAAKITYSRSDVTVNVKADSRGGANVGGFIGKGNGKTDAETIIRNCYATGNVTGGAYTGGFAGGLWGLNIKNCYASGNVSQAAAAMASFVGTDASDPNYYGSITSCFAIGSVTGSSPFRYAFAMQDATKRSEITNCYFAEENSSIKNQNESAAAKPQEEMKTEDFAAALNNGDNSNGWSFVNGQVLCGAEPADYSAVEAALAAIPSDLTVYTDESVAALNTAVSGVVRGKAFVSQANVDAMAQAIEDAIAALQYKDADYLPSDYTMFIGAIATFLKEVEISPFSDVSTSAYYYEAVKWAQEKGITGGIGNGLFGPNQPCTHAQIVTFLWRAAGSPVVNYAMNMSDVPEGSYYAEAVRWALSEGIATGTTGNTFSPDSECTRAQAVAFLFRYAASEAVTLQELVSGFSDADSVPGYALPAMNWALAEEIVQGNGSKLMPNDSCTRAQIVTFLFRTYQGK